MENKKRKEVANIRHVDSFLDMIVDKDKQLID